MLTTTHKITKGNRPLPITHRSLQLLTRLVTSDPLLCASLCTPTHTLALRHWWRMLIRLEQKRATPFLNEMGAVSSQCCKLCTKSFKTQESLLVLSGLQMRMRRPSLMDVLVICFETLKDCCRHNSMWVTPRRAVHTVSPGQEEHQLYRLGCHLFCKEGAWVLWSFCLYFCICFDLEWSLLKSSRNLYCGNKVSKKPSKKTYTILLFNWLCWNISKTRRIPFRVVSAPIMCFSSSVEKNIHIHSSEKGNTCLNDDHKSRLYKAHSRATHKQ